MAEFIRITTGGAAGAHARVVDNFDSPTHIAWPINELADALGAALDKFAVRDFALTTWQRTRLADLIASALLVAAEVDTSDEGQVTP